MYFYHIILYLLNHNLILKLIHTHILINILRILKFIIFIKVPQIIFLNYNKIYIILLYYI